MGEIKGFLKVKRKATPYRLVCERIRDYSEVNILPTTEHSGEQASRCMDCGTPFCHWGCPIGNYIPEWNDLLFRGHWEKAFQLLRATNNFPEITGRVCPATCEYACVLGINDDPVTIKENELAIIEYAFKNDLIRPKAPKKQTGKKIAVVGSGPAGLSCADQLNKVGHKVVVFEKDDKIGGILRFGIPDFKLGKWVLDRRLKILGKEGIEFRASVNVGSDYRVAKLKKEFDVVCLAVGSRVPRDLQIEGRQLKGIYFAMDYLTQSNKRIATEYLSKEVLIDGSTSLTIDPEQAKRIEWIDAKGKKVVVIGGGDTGADCVGTAHRQGAACVIQIELLPRPAECRTKDFPWPTYPLLLKTSSSHEEGVQRHWAVLTKKFMGENGCLKKFSCVKVEFVYEGQNATCPLMREIPGTEFEIEADMVILALGFLHPEYSGLLTELNLELDERANVKTDANYLTSVDKIFSAGDMHRGQSLVVWAISEGRRAAHCIDKYLMGRSNLSSL
jgi:glutamate synthase (NADPH/NADH) small chain